MRGVKEILWRTAFSRAPPPIRSANEVKTLTLFRHCRTITSLHQLESRGVIELSGPDAPKLLQGLITNDMKLLDAPSKSFAATFLNPKGRCISDVIVIATENDTGSPESESLKFLLDCCSDHASSLLRHLRMYKLRSNVRISDQSKQYQVVAATPEYDLDTGVPKALDPIKLVEGLQAFPGAIATMDPRTETMGARAIVPRAERGIEIPSCFRNSSEEDYTMLRMLNCVPEGNELAGRIPLECNLDLLHFVNFSKGCYIGQELTARSFFKGNIRKRFMPFVFQNKININDNSTLSFTTPILSLAKSHFSVPSRFEGHPVDTNLLIDSTVIDDISGETIGKIISLQKGVGIAQLRLENIFSKKFPFLPKIENYDDMILGLFIPSWMPELDKKTGKPGC